MSVTVLAWSLLGFLAIVIFHELTHIAIARSHGHPTVCIAINPLGVAVVFEDAPSRRYWLCQVFLPMLVTAALGYIWLAGLFAIPLAGGGPAQPSPRHLVPLVAAALAVSTSAGDLLSLLLEWRAPIVSEERVRRDLRLLRRIPSLVWFTRYGHARWGTVWERGDLDGVHGEPARGEAVVS